MEVGLIIILFFIENAFALDCLYNKRIKTTGALLIFEFMFNCCFSISYLNKLGKNCSFVVMSYCNDCVIFWW